MNSNRDSEKEMIEFLMSYPEALPSQAKKNRTVIRVQREIRKNRATSMSGMDILFALMLVATVLVLSLVNYLSDFSAGKIVQHFYQLQYWRSIVMYLIIAGLLTTPLLLIILPSNKGGNNL